MTMPKYDATICFDTGISVVEGMRLYFEKKMFY
jgi:hypothetical protein